MIHVSVSTVRHVQRLIQKMQPNGVKRVSIRLALTVLMDVKVVSVYTFLPSPLEIQNALQMNQRGHKFTRKDTGASQKCM